MRNRYLILTVCVVSCLVAAPVNAQIQDWDAWWQDASPLNMDASSWSFDDQAVQYNVLEDYVALTVDDSATASVGLNGGAIAEIIHVEKAVTNNSSFVWTGYEITVDGSAGVNYVSGSGTSDVFGLPVENGNMLIFSEPGTVGIGETVTFNFDVEVPQGQFSFNILQLPVPEPTGLVIFAVGTLLIRRR